MQGQNNPQNSNNLTNVENEPTPNYPTANNPVPMSSSHSTSPTPQNPDPMSSMPNINPTPLSTPTMEKEPISDEQAKNIKKIAVFILVGIVLILAVVISVIFVSKNTATKKATGDKTTTDLIFSLRKEATDFYNQNASYRDWTISEKSQAQAVANNYYVILRKANFQNYMMFSKLSTGKYFCVDSNGFTGEIDLPKENQFLCTSTN